MINKKTIDLRTLGRYTERLSAFLNLSMREIRKKYKNKPVCLMRYIEDNVDEKLIEIRFDEEQITISCTFDMKGKCDSAHLFLDRNEMVEEFITYLKACYDYDYIKNRWILPRHYVKLKETNRLENYICLVFHK